MKSLPLRQLITIVIGFWSIVTDLEYALRLSSFSWVYHLRSLISVSFFLPVDDELVVFLGVGVGALLLFV